MYVEGIFRDRDNHPHEIYWLTLSGEGGSPVESSPHEIDRKHIEFMREVVVKGSRATLTVENELVAPFLAGAIAKDQRK